ncbi:MAG: hypothetical protein HY420_03980 [Candidatus Kerfeldbacteria bacterium]|nr:hypothetical protein [Candidatus Kerfeldbacteria bacterium]
MHHHENTLRQYRAASRKVKHTAKKQWNNSVASQWDLFLPPARPSISELAVIERFLLSGSRRKRNFKVAILGSTPEYRDLCLTYGIDFRCIDYSTTNFSILQQFMVHRDDHKHNLVVADWRTMRLRERFDFIMGDLATTVVPVTDHEAVFRSVRRLCKPSARILLKVPLRQNNVHRTHGEIFRLFRRERKHLQPFAAVWHEVLLADYDFRADTMNCLTSLARLRTSYQKGIITKYEFDSFRARWQALGDFNMNMPLRREYLKKLSPYFKVLEISSGTDWYRSYAPVLILAPR